MQAILESKRVNMGLLVTAALLALMHRHGIELDDNTTAALALGIGALWTAIISSDAAKPMLAKGVLTLDKLRTGNVGQVAAGIVAWVALTWQGYSTLTTPPTGPVVAPSAAVAEPDPILTQPAEQAIVEPPGTPDDVTPRVDATEQPAPLIVPDEKTQAEWRSILGDQ